WYVHEPVVRQAAADRLRKRRRGGELRAYLGRRTHGTPLCERRVRRRDLPVREPPYVYY
ncbi:unnamed protein product, partial [Ectocarpus fasciculatus]